ncbi:MAG: VWA domain-containing protein [Deltaproteobacteria bacterium]|nr:VWA domain-containing protein [Deltaproteobacteria bacterium]
MKEDAAPDLYLDWEERLVGFLIRGWRKFRPKEAKFDVEVAVHLDSQQERLSILAQLFAGQSLLLRPSEAEGGIRGRILLLPSFLDEGVSKEANEELFVLRAIIEGTRIQLGVAAASGDWLVDEVQALSEAARAIAWLEEDFSGFQERFQKARLYLRKTRVDDEEWSERTRALEVLRMSVLDGATIDNVNVEVKRLDELSDEGKTFRGVALWGGALNEPDTQLAEEITAEELKAARTEVSTEIDAPPKDNIERAFLDEEDDADVMPMHTFEKVETLDEFNGNMRRTDGSDELEDHLEALDEVDLRHVIRGGEATESVFRAELDGLSVIPDVDHAPKGEEGVFYDEWADGEGRYKKNWVTVYPSVAALGDDEWAQSRLADLQPLRRKLKRRLEAHRQTRQWIGRQREGDELDLDALVESYGDRLAGLPDEERLFRRNPRRRREIATTVLLDISLSSDSWVENKRVLDVSRDAILLLGEVADDLGDSLEVLAFASNTRNHCRVWRVKDWRDSWRIGRQRLGALTPTGYTRIGPALRHASAGLAKHAAEQKLLLLITDGKPNDYDRYEGRHGIADVRQAVREGKQLGIQTHAIGIDPSAARALPVMFGKGGSQLLRHLAALPETLVEAYGKAN